MKKTGLTLVEAVVVITIMVFLAGVLMPGLRSPRCRAIRLVCQTNLRGIGRAMIAFAEQNNGAFPRAGGPGATWTSVGVIMSWHGGRSNTEDEAFCIIRDSEGNVVHPGEATITSSFYLLIRHSMLRREHFVCPGDSGASLFDIRLYRNPFRRGHEEVWDFGNGDPRGYLPYPGEVCSYAYHMPYCDGEFGPSLAITDLWHPRSPVCADRNPHLDKNALSPGLQSNSVCHGGRGQNVLYKDGSVKFETSVTVGLGGDNIYTYGGDYATGGGDPNGTPPLGNGDGAPVGSKDAYLVGEQNYR
ncbi:MAG: type II secretion system protein [Planctomycetota bacterium]